MSDGSAARYPSFESPDGGFRALCESLLGRPNLRGDLEWRSSSFGLCLILSDLALIQCPWWKICRQAGLFFFREHILLNQRKLHHSLGDDHDTFCASLFEEGYMKVTLTVHLQEVLARILNPTDSIEDWQLVQVPTGSADAMALRKLLALTKCPAITTFSALDPATLRPQPPSPFDTHGEVNVDIPPTDSNWVEIHSHPGEYYKRLIPEHVISGAEQSWLFRLPEEAGPV
jgi:hypothetical protein